MTQSDHVELRRQLDIQFEAVRQSIKMILYPKKGDRERAAQRLNELCG